MRKSTGMIAPIVRSIAATACLAAALLAAGCGTPSSSPDDFPAFTLTDPEPDGL